MRISGYSVPFLAEIAKKITCLISSAGACERVWSAYRFIHSTKRNKLTAERANDLVYVYSNMILIAKLATPEKFAEWVGGESDSDDETEEEIEAILGTVGWANVRRCPVC